MTRLFVALSFFVNVSLWAQEQIPFPEGCGNPFVQDGTFGDFFEKAIQSAVIEAGSVSNSHINLFAINKMRKLVAEKYPSPTDGEVVDRHIRAQLCVYAEGKKDLKSTSIELQRHLMAISSRLLKDVKRVVMELNAKEIERQKSLERYEAHFALLEKAERLAGSEFSLLEVAFLNSR